MLASWSIDILRQSNWDLWCWISIAAALTLLANGVLARLSGRKLGFSDILLNFAPALVTCLILSIPVLRRPGIGLVWLILLLILVSFAHYQELQSRLSRLKINWLLGLRSLAICLAVPMLFEPVLRIVRSQSPDRPLILLADASGSMSVQDYLIGQSRFQQASQAIAGQWDQMLSNYAPSIIPFGITASKALNKPSDLNSITPDGQSTDLTAAISSAISQNKRTDAEVILLSDGIDNASPDVAAAISALKVPVHTVLVGSDQSQPSSLVNVAVEETNPGDEWTVRSDATIETTIRSSSLAGRVVQVNLAEVDESGKPIATPISQQLVLDSKPNGQVVKFDYTPQHTGIYRMAIWIDPIAGERSTADNKRIFQQLANDARIRVLYIEGRVRPEYTQLFRALSRDANIELATLLRVTGDRFNASGGINGKPVNSIPVQFDQWRQIDLIILGDLDSSYLNPQRMSEIEKAVSDGSSLLMLGGKSSLGPGGYGGTPIEKILPVTLGSRDAKQDAAEFIPLLSVAGENHPAMQQLNHWFTGKAADNQLPTLLGNVVVDQAKPGADVLLTHPLDNGSSQIVLAVQRYGKGRSAVFTADTTYRWYLPMRGLGQDSPYTIFWGQLVRWLAGTDVKNRGTKQGVETIVDKSIFTVGEKVRVRALVRDTRGDATRYAQVKINLTREGGTGSDQVSQPFTPTDGRDGMYELSLGNLGRGNWSAEIIATKDGSELGKQTIHFSISPPADEMFKLAANPGLMKDIASKTGGFSYPVTQFPQLIEALNRKHASGSIEQHTVPVHNLARLIPAVVGIYPDWPAVYDLPVQSLLVMILLSAEWMLRRRYELP